jgi:hypothetical protein
VCVLLCAVASPAAAEPPPESERWVPALGVSSGALIQKSDGNLDSNATGFLRDDVLALYPFLEGNLELMSPALLSGSVQPRLFVRGGVGMSWDALHRNPKQGDPGPLLIPNIGTVSLEAVQGRGAETRSQAKPLFYTASAGVALSLPFDEERALRLKSSVEYRYGATEIEAVLSDAQSINDDEVCPCRLGRLQATDEKDQHALGMGVELELDAARLGPFLLAVHVGGQARRLMDGRKLRVSATGFYDDGVTPIDITSETQLERWNFQVGVGLRFRWLPE